MGRDELGVKFLIQKALTYWYFYAIGFPLLVLLGLYHLASSPKSYEATALILIKDQKESGQVSEEYILDEFGISSRFKNLENEILVLTSLPLLESIVSELDLHYNYLRKERFQTPDLYKKSPIRVLNWQVYDPDCGIDPLKTCALKATLGFDYKNGYSLQTEDSIYTGEWGKELRLRNGILTLTKTSDEGTDAAIILNISSIRSRANKIKQDLEVEAIGDNSSTIRLSIKDVSSRRAFDILTGVIKAYNETTVKEKSEIYRNTIDLLNNRIDLVTDDLAATESGMANYKSRYNMVQAGSEATMILNDLSTYNKDIADREVRLDILKSIENLLVQNRDSFTFVPPNLNLDNANLSRQLESFNRLLAQRDKSKIDLGPSHPDLVLVEEQLQNLRNTIIFNIKSIREELSAGQESDSNFIASLENRLRSLPSRERALIAMERQKSVKENLYLYLLQKREEAAVSLVVLNTPGKIVQPPAVRGPVSPIPAQIMLIAFFLGFALPTGAIVIAEALNDRVRTEEELTTLTKIPLLGSISIAKSHGDQPAFAENGRSSQAEMFRILRANLAYITPDKELKVLLITSNMSNEGKSFITLNLGMAQALAGKKTLIIDLDIRKAESLMKNDKTNNSKGVVDYLIKPTLSKNHIISNTGFHPRLDVIKSGSFAPNPGELILSEKLEKLVEKLKSEYDFIILDSSPVGAVADPLRMGKLADATMFVVRANYTHRSQLKYLNQLVQDEKLPNVFLVLNALKLGLLHSYGTRYHYSKYYHKSDKRHLLKDFRNGIGQGKKYLERFRRQIY